MSAMITFFFYGVIFIMSINSSWIKNTKRYSLNTTRIKVTINFVFLSPPKIQFRIKVISLFQFKRRRPISKHRGCIPDYQLASKLLRETSFPSQLRGQLYNFLYANLYSLCFKITEDALSFEAIQKFHFDYHFVIHG